MGNWPVIIGWAIALACTWVAVSSSARVIRHVAETRRRSGLWRLWNAPGWPAMPLAYGCASLAAFTALGVLPLLQGALLAVMPAAALAAVLGADIMKRKDGRLLAVLAVAWSLVTRVPRAGFSCLWGDLRALAGRRRGEEPRQASPQAAPVSPAAPSPAPAQGPATAPREVPPIREDPALGSAPQAADVAAGLATSGVEIPEPWAQLIAYVADRVAENSNEQDRFLLGDAAGAIGLGEAYHSHAANVTDEIGLDPAYGSAILDIGDAVADKSGDIVQAYRRFHLIYEEIIKFVENGGVLPFRSREFFSGPGGSGPQDEAGESAA